MNSQPTNGSMVLDPPAEETDQWYIPKWKWDQLLLDGIEPDDPAIRRMEKLKQILQERGQSYGPWQDTLTDLGKLWGTLLSNRLNQQQWSIGSPLAEELVAFMLCLLKVVRELNGHKVDNLDDLANYALFGAAIGEQKAGRS